MVKHYLSEEDVKSILHPDEEKQLQEAKTDIQDEVKRILELIQKTEDEEDCSSSKLLAEVVHFIEKFQHRYARVHAIYSQLKELVKSSETGLENEFGTRNDLESFLRHEKKEETDMDLKTEAAEVSSAKIGKVDSELENLKNETESWLLKKETALLNEESNGLRSLIDGLIDEKLGLEKELPAARGEVSLELQGIRGEASVSQVTKLNHNLKFTDEEMESLKVKASEGKVKLASSDIIRKLEILIPKLMMKRGALREEKTVMERYIEKATTQTSVLKERVQRQNYFFYKFNLWKVYNEDSGNEGDSGDAEENENVEE